LPGIEPASIVVDDPNPLPPEQTVRADWLIFYRSILL
jgi:hypothetical protein